MTKTWAEIRQSYSNFNTPLADTMIALVVAIESSRYATRLFAWNSYSELCIVPNPVEYPYDGEYLRVTPLDSGDLEFRYRDTQVVVSPGQAFAALESMIEQL